jgi:cellulose synthase/poly-beta-1,6-N-acetylglucosamine synthase-like glycosyltransferase
VAGPAAPGGGRGGAAPDHHRGSTLNEEALIGAKLADLACIDYPLDRQTVLVVDGGSQDRTCEIVQREIAHNGRLRLLRIEGAAGQADQVGRALEGLAHPIVVVTDADARLDRGCVRELVRERMQDADLAVAGALVRPRTTLIEERLYWWGLNGLSRQPLKSASWSSA